MIEYTNIIYIRDLSALGGVEMFTYQLAKKYKDLDIAVVCKYADENQKKRIKEYCPVIIHKNQKINCKVAVINYDTSIIDYICKDAKIYEVCHGDYHNKAYNWKMPTHDRVYKYIGITNIIKNNLFEDVGKDKTMQIYNPLSVNKERPLILLSATRLSPIKGKNRMIKLGEALDKAKVNYIWFILTNDTQEIKSPNIVWLKPTLETDKWFNLCDIVVQLSDTEACSYTQLEGLYRNKTLITTPLPYLKEIGVEDGKNAFILDYDCSNIDEIVKNIKKLDFEFKELKSDYDKILEKSKSKYKEEQMKIYKVKVIIDFYDTEEKKQRKVGDIIEVNRERYEYLSGNNPKKIVAVELIEIEELAPIVEEDGVHIRTLVNNEIKEDKQTKAIVNKKDSKKETKKTNKKK